MTPTVASVHLSQDAYQGEAEFTIAVNGAAYANASAPTIHPAAGPAWLVPCNLGDTISITFTNDAYGGDAAHDRNLYVSVEAAGIAYPEAFLATTGSALTVTVGGGAVTTGLYAAFGPNGPTVFPQTTPPVVAPTPSPPAPAPNPPTVTPAPVNLTPEMVLVGPGQPFEQITDAMVYMWSQCNPGTGAPDTVANRLKLPKHVILMGAPDGYYDNDTGTHSARWPAGSAQAKGWPTSDGNIWCPLVIEGEPGKPPALLRLPFGEAGYEYFQQGWFNFMDMDATIRNIHFQIPAGPAQLADGRGGIGNTSALRFNTNGDAKTPWTGNFLVERVVIEGFDDGILGGTFGQTMTLKNIEVFNCGNSEGLQHNIYIGPVDLLTVDGIYSHDAIVGHCLKSRAQRTEFAGKTRLFAGVNGTASACLDTPNGGHVLIPAGATVTMQKAPPSGAAWVWHFGGENHDDGGPAYHGAVGSSVTVAGTLVMVSPADGQLTDPRQSSTVPVGFANQTGGGLSGASDTVTIVPVVTGAVEAFGMSDHNVGLTPHTMLPAAPTLDLTSPFA